MTKITPIFKQGSRTLYSNYRLISILSYFAELMEKIMYDRLNKSIVQNNVLHPLQRGLQTGHSTVMSLLNVHDAIENK